MDNRDVGDMILEYDNYLEEALDQAADPDDLEKVIPAHARGHGFPLQGTPSGERASLGMDTLAGRIQIQNCIFTLNFRAAGAEVQPIYRSFVPRNV